MVKTNARQFKISCTDCGSSVGTIGSIMDNITNEWDKDEPTRWVQQRLDAADLGVLTHVPLYCTTCKPVRKIGTVKMVFDSRSGAKLEV